MLPPDALRKLKQMRSFTLTKWDELTALPESLGACVALKELILLDCPDLRRSQLPASVRALEDNGLLCIDISESDCDTSSPGELSDSSSY